MTKGQVVTTVGEGTELIGQKRGKKGNKDCSTRVCITVSFSLTARSMSSQSLPMKTYPNPCTHLFPQMYRVYVP